MEASGTMMGARYLTIRPARPVGHGRRAVGGGQPQRARPDGCRTLFLKNVPYEADEAAVQEAIAYAAAAGALVHLASHHQPPPSSLSLSLSCMRLRLQRPRRGRQRPHAALAPHRSHEGHRVRGDGQ